MKPIKSTIMLLVLGFTSITRPDNNCMDNSKYGDLSDGFDYKKYYHAQCNCPCERYTHSYKRGLCEQCLHYRAPQPLSEKQQKLISVCESAHGIISSQYDESEEYTNPFAWYSDMAQ
ncbi:MAG: hypothetical protein WCE21_05505 [Candidatus Babeliales bacterium]